MSARDFKPTGSAFVAALRKRSLRSSYRGGATWTSCNERGFFGWNAVDTVRHRGGVLARQLALLRHLGHAPERGAALKAIFLIWLG